MKNGSTAPTTQSVSLGITLGVILLAALARLVPHWPNFTPVGALALYGGYRLGWKQALPVTLGAMLLSDVLLEVGYRYGIFQSWGFHGLLPVIYVAFVLVMGIGRMLRWGPLSVPTLACGALAGSCLFFAVTNLADWWRQYPHDLAGLAECYTMALPFFQYTVAGDLFYTFAIFGTTYLLERAGSLRPVVAR